jgi:hypothetical protein
MPFRRPKKKKNSRLKSDVIALKESANLKSPSEQALLCLTTDALLEKALFNKQPTTNSLSKDL